MHLTREGNPDQYLVASMDTRLRAKLRKGGRTPTLYMNQNVFIMEPLPTGRTVEGAAPAPTPPAQKQGDAPPPTTAAAAAAGDEGGSAAASNIITSAGAPKAKVGGRKRGPSGPNPLSQKKPKKKPRAEGDAEAGSEQKKRNRRRKKTDTAAAGGAPAAAATAAAAE